MATTTTVAKPTGQVIGRRFAPGEEDNSVRQALKDYPTRLGLKSAGMSHKQIQEWIQKDLEKLSVSRMSKAKKSDRAFWLAFAWGQTLVEELGWQWMMLEDEAGHKTSAVVSPNKSHAVPVLQFMEKLATEQEDTTSQLLYNMIVAGDLSPAKPGELKIML